MFFTTLTSTRRVSVLVSLILALGACGQAPTEPDGDSAVVPDSGNPVADSGTVTDTSDAGAVITDSGNPTEDAGQDSGTVVEDSDSTSSDAGQDSGSSADAGLVCEPGMTVCEANNTCVLVLSAGDHCVAGCEMGVCGAGLHCLDDGSRTNTDICR
jgi:hypothetical protein